MKLGEYLSQLIKERSTKIVTCVFTVLGVGSYLDGSLDAGLIAVLEQAITAENWQLAASIAGLLIVSLVKEGKK